MKHPKCNWFGKLRALGVAVTFKFSFSEQGSVACGVWEDLQFKILLMISTDNLERV